ncbi:MAG: acetyl-CoA carboxylase biotin carboxyl carrier protein [Gemmatimonadota bacterium]|nr:acetyl-CoA carboxylase biotin carboxyl carrier protein [Gemmatimonadota bacterium]MXW06073.1 acetyl-CoA carboxylase biotin carboxyl carrier protein [Gemmatimonadota bacterium]MYB61391.1 acetyl-CoA carboxylase biotin carboxyl carrier protein [Gemmatimonadota bacterium]
MGIDEVLKLIESLRDTDIQEVEVAEGDRKIRIVRMTAGATAAAVPAPAADTHVQAAAPPAEHVRQDVGQADSADNTYVEVTSPMVGTFYRSPEPDADPFVQEQDRISTGQQLCIIEAMKLMNPIQSELNGRVMAILVEDAQPVEYGQPLFLIEPA